MVCVLLKEDKLRALFPYGASQEMIESDGFINAQSPFRFAFILPGINLFLVGGHHDGSKKCYFIVHVCEHKRSISVVDDDGIMIDASWELMGKHPISGLGTFVFRDVSSRRWYLTQFTLTTMAAPPRQDRSSSSLDACLCNAHTTLSAMTIDITAALSPHHHIVSTDVCYVPLYAWDVNIIPQRCHDDDGNDHGPGGLGDDNALLQVLEGFVWARYDVDSSPRTLHLSTLHGDIKMRPPLSNFRDLYFVNRNQFYYRTEGSKEVMGHDLTTGQSIPIVIGSHHGKHWGGVPVYKFSRQLRELSVHRSFLDDDDSVTITVILEQDFPVANATISGIFDDKCILTVLANFPGPDSKGRRWYLDFRTRTSVDFDIPRQAWSEAVVWPSEAVFNLSSQDLAWTNELFSLLAPLLPIKEVVAMIPSYCLGYNPRPTSLLPLRRESTYKALFP